MSDGRELRPRGRTARGILLILLASVALDLASAGPALANDTTASTGAGGLEIRNTDAIDMVSEDLFVSVDKIEVRYLFRNRTRSSVSTIVAFPMPDRDLSLEYGADVAFPSPLQTLVNGKPVRATLERKAMVRGIDHSNLLTQLGIPIAPENIAAATAAMDRLPKMTRQRLVRAGLADEEIWDEGRGMKKHLVPLWTVKDIWWWNQAFPAGLGVEVRHSYVPGVGGSVESPFRYGSYRGTQDAREARERYCVTDAFIAGIDRASARNPQMGLRDYRIDYVLTTGANWRSPIGNFRLVVDKGQPANLLSFCGSPVRQTSATRYEVRLKNWRPTRDLHLLIVEPSRGSPPLESDPRGRPIH